ncbi:serine hydrolase domain-containing protein [uncultured Nocardioides sp.]|uniref:serine hydrolase domain-containing protein n=1 Tax=uncultured Nocardioides sp. TaxID=198441 RepID=UPI00261E2545|nr:serine hydrolase domain-containing protein [uncultured Nocardioides sp.]HRD61597.1 serine hydrolase domain-containing protein [Nocardioides sp.]
MTGRAGRAALVALVLLTFGGATAAASPGSSPVGEVRQADVSIGEAERVLEAQLAESGVPGGAVALVSKGQVDARGVGSAGGDREVTADTPFVIGSATKSFTALAVMQLVDAGLVDLEASVRDYVPELELADGQRVDDITVRDLLQQTSGLDDLAGGPLLASAADGTPLAAIAELKDAKLTSTPGEAWGYANANYVLAGLIVERASGMRYGDYVQREIFTPLGMTHSSATTDPAGSDVLADGHRFWFGLPVATEPTRRNATLAAGYLISTAADLGRYLSMHLAEGLAPDGTRIVSADGIRTLLGGGPDATLGAWADGQDSRYAMGWFVGGPWGENAVFHPGNTPDTTTMLTLFPDRDVAVAVVVNAGNELPVPGNPFIADRITRNVVHSTLGQPVLDLPSMWRFYALFDLVALLLLAGTAWGLLRAVPTVTSPSPSRHPARGWAGILVRTLGVGLLVLVPTLSYGWGGLWTWASDLAVVIAALALLLAATAAVRATGLLRAKRADSRAAASSTERVPQHASP